MLFNSFEFMLFFPIVTALYFILPHKFRWLMLLIASCIFYMSFIPVYILILAITIIIDYFAGMWIENSEGKTKKTYLIVSILSTCLVLFIFKYFNFFNESFASMAAFLHLNYPIGMLNIILPIGLSFHTFQSLSYVIEVYRGHQKAEKHFGIYSLYVMFYPQLVAGPIERPQNLLHQFREKHYFEYKRVTDGLKLMAWGMFKKVVIADRLGILVNKVYDNPTEFDGLALIIAAIFFSFQIYCDFSGYSDIAIGSAQVMGFTFMDNFRRPNSSRSIAEFWKRWHISLSTWFRDYLYIPLGGNRVPKWRWQLNIFITFAVSGLWHGANWTYIIWGSLNGFYFIFAFWTKEIRKKIATILGLIKYPRIFKAWQILVVFTLIALSRIFFRSENVSEAWYILSHLFDGIWNIFNVQYVKDTIRNLGLSKFELTIALLSILFMEIVHAIQNHHKIRHFLSEKPIWFRWLMYYVIVFGIIFFGVFEKTSFIYFQF